MTKRFEWRKTPEEFAGIRAKNEEIRQKQRQMEKGRLSSEEAHDEANMLRAQAGVSPETDKIRTRQMVNWSETWGRDRKTTAEDYDLALKALEEMKRLAAKEPETQKLLMQLGRMAERTRYILRGILMLPIDVLGSVGGDDPILGSEVKHRDIMERLTDASKQLIDLKKQASKFEDQK